MSSQMQLWSKIITIGGTLIGTLAGTILGIFMKNIGRIKISSNGIECKYTIINNEIGYTDFSLDRSINTEEFNGLLFTSVIDIYNSSDSIKTIKDLKLIIKKNKCYDVSTKELYLNDKEFPKKGFKYINILKLYPKDIVRVEIRGNIELGEELNIIKHGFKLYLCYQKNNRKRKEKFLDRIEEENMANPYSNN